MKEAPPTSRIPHQTRGLVILIAVVAWAHHAAFVRTERDPVRQVIEV